MSIETKMLLVTVFLSFGIMAVLLYKLNEVVKKFDDIIGG